MQPLALTLGEPAGIGPDLALAVWRRRAELDLPAFYICRRPGFSCAPGRAARPRRADGRRDAGAAAATFRGAAGRRLDVAVTAEPGQPDRTSAPAAVASIRRAVADVMAGAAAAVVTNPVAKNVLYSWGFAEPGHTEFLAKLVARSDRQGVAPGDDVMVAGARRGAGDDPSAAARTSSDADRPTLLSKPGASLRAISPARFGLARPRLADRRPQSACRRGRHARRGGPHDRCAGGRAAQRRGYRCERVRCPPTRCSTNGRAPPTTPRCACITTRR